MKATNPNHSTFDHEDPPPPYESVAPNVPDALGVGMRDDGRMDMDVDGSLGRQLTRLVQDHETTSSPPQGAPSIRETTPIVTCPAKLNIIIQVVGSRGDVQPFVALGCELQQQHGHRVRIATHAVFEDFVRKAGLEFYPIGGDPADLMAYIVKNPGLIPSVASVRAGDIGRKRRMLAEILEGCWSSCYKPDEKTQRPFVADAIIANPPSFGHVHCAQALGIPLHIMFTMPWTSTRAFAHPLANLKYSSDTSPRVANMMSYGVVEWMTWQGIGDLINNWRTRTLDLEPVPSSEGPLLLETLNIPHTYCWSPALVPRPSDWPEYIDVCGFFFREPPSYKPPPDLRTFLEAGSTPIYIGFGSIVIEDPEALTEMILEAVRMTGVRALISRGWSKLGQDRKSDDTVFYLEDCPHEWLFDHVAAVIHHGGAGTTACGLSKGVPSFLVPFFGDQPFWGIMVAASGAGPEPIAYQSLSAVGLARGITTCLAPETRQAAMEVAEKMSTETGVYSAVQSFHAQLPVNLKCDVIGDEPAAWTFRDGSKTTKLSKRAAALLARQGMLKSTKLTHCPSKPITIDPKRWEPVSAVVSASLHTAGSIGRAAAGVVSEPYQVYKNTKNQPDSPDAEAGPSKAKDHGHDESERSAKSADAFPNEKRKTTDQTLPTHITEEINGTHHQGDSSIKAESEASANRRKQIMKASARSAGKFFFSPVKGIVLDIPLAAVEGMWALPRLHGDTGYQHTAVTDWKSGGSVAAKSFVHGIHEGMTDIFVKTYAAKRKEGAIGVAKGLSMGFVNLTMKTGAGTLGLIAYPCQGVYKSIHTAMHTKAKSAVEQAKLEEGEWMLKNQAKTEVEVEDVVQRFLRAVPAKGKGKGKARV